MKPILKYGGGKRKELEKIKQYIPKFFNTYFEPFVGGGAVYFDLEYDKSVINDRNKNLIEFYNSVRNNYDELTDQITYLQKLYENNQTEFEINGGENKNRKLYYQIRDMYNGKASNEYLRPAIFYFLNRTAFSGITRFNSKGEFNVGFGMYKGFSGEFITSDHSLLLQKTKILCGDFSKVFDLAQKNDFMFLDPPYDATFCNYDGNGFYEEDHRRLAAAFKKLKCKTLMIIGETELINDLYKEYIVERYSKIYSLAMYKSTGNKAVAQNNHLIITNF